MLLAFAATAMAWLALARDQLAASLAWHVAAVGLTGESLQVRQARAATGGALASAWFWVLFPGFGALAAAMLLLESGRSARRRHEESWELRRLRAAAAARAEKQRGQDLDGDV